MANEQPLVQEEEHISRGSIVGVTLFVLGFGGLLVAISGVLLSGWRRSLPVAQGVIAAPAPAPEVSNVRSELFRGPGAGQVLKAQQRDQLSRYRWVDRAHGIVGVPIDVAIELVAEEPSR